VSAELAGSWKQIAELTLPGNALVGSIPNNWSPSLKSIDLQ